MTTELQVNTEPQEVEVDGIAIISNNSTSMVQWNTGGDAWHSLYVGETIKVDFSITIKSSSPAKITISKV